MASNAKTEAFSIHKSLARKRSSTVSPQATASAKQSSRRKSRVSVVHFVPHFSDRSSEENIMSIVPRFLSDVAHQRWHILPGARFKVRFDICICIFILYTAVVMPVELTFNHICTYRSSIAWTIAGAIIDVAFIVDIFFSLHLAFYDEDGVLITHVPEIQHQYLFTPHVFNSRFMVDFLAGIPLSLIEAVSLLHGNTQRPETSGKLLKMFKFLRLLRLKQVWLMISDLEFKAAIKLALLFSCWFLVAHWLTCAWYYLGEEWQKSFLPEGISIAQLNAEQEANMYLTSTYFIYATLTTVGYGDISPSTKNEEAFGVCLMIFGSILYAIIFGIFSTLLNQVGRHEEVYHKRVETLNAFMRQHNVPAALQEKVRGYEQFLWTRHKSRGVHDAVLEGLPHSLKAMISEVIHRRMLSISPIFLNCANGFVQQLSAQLHPKIYSPDDYVFVTGELADKIYFIKFGEIAMETEDEGLLV